MTIHILIVDINMCFTCIHKCVYIYIYIELYKSIH